MLDVKSFDRINLLLANQQIVLYCTELQDYGLYYSVAGIYNSVSQIDFQFAFDLICKVDRCS